MENKTLNEQVNRIKQMMGMINEHNFIPDPKKFTDLSRDGYLDKVMGPIIPPDEMGYEKSGVEDDDYDERQERNYGVEDLDRDSDEELWGPEEDEEEDYLDRLKREED